MKKNVFIYIFIVLMLVSSVSASILTAKDPLALNVGGGDYYWGGYFITNSTNYIQIFNVTKQAGDNSNQIVIMSNSTNTTVAVASFVGNTATFASPYQPQLGKVYLVLANNTGGARTIFYSYTYAQPVNYSQLRYLHGTWGWSFYGANNFSTDISGTQWNSIINMGVEFGLSPSIDFNNPTPPNGQFYNTSHNYIEINVSTSNVANLVTAYLNIYNSTDLYNTTIFSSGNWSYNYTNLPYDNYWINATAFNSTNTYYTDTRQISVGKGILTINATNYTGGAISNFTFNINGSIYNTTTGQIQVNITLGQFYDTNLTADNYSYSYYNFTANQSQYQYKSFILYPTNSINLTIVDEITSAQILQNIDISLSSNTSLYNYSTITGNYFISNIDVGSYIMTLTSANYITRTYVLTVTNKSTQSLTARLLNNTNSIAIGVYTKTQSSTVLPAVLYTIQRQYAGGSFATVVQGITDVNGFTTFYIQSGINYRVILSASGFNTKQFDQQFYLANSPYTFNLVQTGASLYINYLEGVSYYYTPTNTTLHNGTQSFSITTYNATFNIAWTAVNTNGTIVNVSGSPGGATATSSVNLVNYSGIYPVIYMFNFQDQNTGEFRTISIPINYYIENRQALNNTLPSAMNQFKTDTGSAGWTAIISVFVILIAVVTVIQISGNLLAGVVTGVATMIMFAIIGWISPALVGAIAVISILGWSLTRGNY